VGKGTKERILTTGVDLLSRNGFAGVTPGVLSQNTGMSKNGLFAHFKSKDEVQLELLEETTRIGFTSFENTEGRCSTTFIGFALRV
jgi:AcrR family transcriptional regulator